MTARTLKIEDAIRSGAEVPNIRRLLKSNEVRVIEDKEGNRKVLFGDETALGKLARKGKISIREYEAGILFKNDWFVAVGPGVRAQSYEPAVCGGGNQDDPVSKLTAQSRLDGDRDRMGPDLYSCVVGVCGTGQSPAEWAESAGKHRDIGNYLIGVALDRLAHSRKLPR